MYRYTVHNIKDNGGAIESPGEDFFFLSAVAPSSNVIVCLWRNLPPSPADVEWGASIPVDIQDHPVISSWD